MLFNPPYVPTDPSEVGSEGIEAAWAGGLDGRQVIDRVLPLIPRILSPDGVFYLITVEENQPSDIAVEMQRFGYKMQTIRQIKARNERLAVQKFIKN